MVVFVQLWNPGFIRSRKTEPIRDPKLDIRISWISASKCILVVYTCKRVLHACSLVTCISNNSKSDNGGVSFLVWWRKKIVETSKSSLCHLNFTMETKKMAAWTRQLITKLVSETISAAACVEPSCSPFFFSVGRNRERSWRWQIQNGNRLRTVSIRGIIAGERRCDVRFSDFPVGWCCRRSCRWRFGGLITRSSSLVELCLEPCAVSSSARTSTTQM